VWAPVPTGIFLGGKAHKQRFDIPLIDGVAIVPRKVTARWRELSAALNAMFAQLNDDTGGAIGYRDKDRLARTQNDSHGHRMTRTDTDSTD